MRTAPLSIGGNPTINHALNIIDRAHLKAEIIMPLEARAAGHRDIPMAHLANQANQANRCVISHQETAPQSDPAHPHLHRTNTYLSAQGFAHLPPRSDPPPH